tara:strand:+ start:139 stop:765 length:627 start_codon:yes stop_codon:yes gene_type:complete
MATYNASGGCVYGETLVTRLIETDNTIISINVNKIKPDMLLLTRNTSTDQLEFSRVELMTIQVYSGNLVWYPNDIALTPWHPVRNVYDNGYVFPELDARNTGKNYKRFGHWNPIAPEVFDFVLENRGDLILGDINADKSEKIAMITLGHGITDDPVAVHKYLGSSDVIKDLNHKSLSIGETRIIKIVKYIRNTNSHPDANQIIKLVFE